MVRVLQTLTPNQIFSNPADIPGIVMHGQAVLAGKSPDGDTLKFFTPDRGLVRKLNIKGNKSGQFSLRFSHIDTLETHFAGAAQPFSPANAATDAMLDFVGAGERRWQQGGADSDRGTITWADPDNFPVTAITTGGDNYGRAVAFVYPGHQWKHGQRIEMTADVLASSANYMIAEQGLGHCMPYLFLTESGFSLFNSGSKTAREEGLGLYTDDQTHSGFKVSGRGSLTEDIIMVPKLFRRLMSWIESLHRQGDRRWRESNRDTFKLLMSVPEGVQAIDRVEKDPLVCSDGVCWTKPHTFSRMKAAFDQSFGAHFNMDNFIDYLSNNPDPVIVAGGELLAENNGNPFVTALHHTLQVDNGAIALEASPEDLIWIPRNHPLFRQHGSRG